MGLKTKISLKSVEIPDNNYNLIKIIRHIFIKQVFISKNTRHIIKSPSFSKVDYFHRFNSNFTEENRGGGGKGLFWVNLSRFRFCTYTIIVVKTYLSQIFIIQSKIRLKVNICKSILAIFLAFFYDDIEFMRVCRQNN